jgi:AcrR family transcriptional regulator
MAGSPTSTPSARARRLDEAQTANVLQCVIEELAERGFDRLTMDRVAARAGAGKQTLYRRWPSKTEMVIDAVTTWKQTPVVPDTGSLRGDLLASARAFTRMGTFDSDVIGGLITACRHHPELAKAFDANFVTPRHDVLRTIMRRARDRGEIARDKDVELLAPLIPAMVFQQTQLKRRPVSAKFVARLVDEVLLPVLTAP